MNPLEQSILLLIISMIYSFLGGLLTRNYSQVDRLWSILPAIYVLIWMQEIPLLNLRFYVASTLVILWAIRLSGNFARRGGYRFSLSKGFYDEDYRWPILKEKIPNRFLFELFNLSFISIFQLGLIFLFTFPVYVAGHSETPWNITDTVLTLLFSTALILEFIADNQQWKFQNEKRDPANQTNPRFLLGFNTFGLWKFSRHPNYFFEMSQWVIIALFGINAFGKFHWSTCGSLILITLFIGSTIMAEQLTASKYPLYKLWKKATPPWIPFLDSTRRTKDRNSFWENVNRS